MLHDLGLIDEIPPWYSPVKPKPGYGCTGILGCANVCRTSRDEFQQSGRPHRQSQEQVSHHTRDELSMGQQQREEE